MNEGFFNILQFKDDTLEPGGGELSGINRERFTDVSKVGTRDLRGLVDMAMEGQQETDACPPSLF